MEGPIALDLDEIAKYSNKMFCCSYSGRSEIGAGCFNLNSSVA